MLDVVLIWGAEPPLGFQLQSLLMEVVFSTVSFGPGSSPLPRISQALAHGCPQSVEAWGYINVIWGLLQRRLWGYSLTESHAVVLPPRVPHTHCAMDPFGYLLKPVDPLSQSCFVLFLKQTLNTFKKGM